MQFISECFYIQYPTKQTKQLMVCGERGDRFLVTIRTEESHNEHIGRNLLNTFYCYTF